MTGKKHEHAFRDDPRTWYWLERWRRKAKHQLKIEPLCRYCLERGKVKPAEVADHIVPVNGSWDRFWFGALQSLCFECHNEVKRAEEEQGYRPGFGVDGAPLDPKHPAYAARSPSEHQPKSNPKTQKSKKPNDLPLPKIDLWI